MFVNIYLSLTNVNTTITTPIIILYKTDLEITLENK